MPHHWQAIFELRDAAQWPQAEAALRDSCRSTGTDVELVRIGLRVGLVVLRVEDEPELAGQRASVIDPWLAGLSLAGELDVRSGEIVDLSSEQGTHGRALAFVEHVMRTKQVWGLYGETWAREDAEDDAEVLPFWPSAELAARCVRGPWATFAPRAIALEAFIEQWLTGMDEDGIVAAVSPTPSQPGERAAPRSLLALLVARSSD